jgi:hypothetical protein
MLKARWRTVSTSTLPTSTRWASSWSMMRRTGRLRKVHDTRRLRSEDSTETALANRHLAAQVAPVLVVVMWPANTSAPVNQGCTVCRQHNGTGNIPSTTFLLALFPPLHQEGERTSRLSSVTIRSSSVRFRYLVHLFRRPPKSGRLRAGIAGRLRSESLVDLNRNQWTTSTGMGGRLAPEYAH